MSKWIITKGPSLSDYRDENHVSNKDRVSYSKSTGKEYNDATELLEDILNMDELKTAYKLRMYLDRASTDSKYWRVTFCFDCLNEIGRKSDYANNKRIYTATFELNAEPTQKELDGYEGVELDMIDEELQDATLDVGLDYQWMNYDVKPEDIFESRSRRGRMLREDVERYDVYIDNKLYDSVESYEEARDIADEAMLDHYVEVVAEPGGLPVYGTDIEESRRHPGRMLEESDEETVTFQEFKKFAKSLGYKITSSITSFGGFGYGSARFYKVFKDDRRVYPLDPKHKDQYSPGRWEEALEKDRELQEFLLSHEIIDEKWDCKCIPERGF